MRTAPSGLEMMLRSLGLGEVITAAQDLAQSGAIEKIIKFADSVDELNARLSRIEIALGRNLEPPTGPALVRLAPVNAGDIGKSDAEPLAGPSRTGVDNFGSDPFVARIDR
jgi:hypothetical protein